MISTCWREEEEGSEANAVVHQINKQNLPLPVPHPTQEEMEVDLIKTTLTLLDTSGIQRQEELEELEKIKADLISTCWPPSRPYTS